MKTKCSKYTPKDISRFVDNELFEDQCKTLAQHIEQCPHCSQLSMHYRTLSIAFNDHVREKQDLKINKAVLEQKFNSVIQNNEKKPWGNIFGFSKKFIVVKLAGIAMISLISLFTFQKVLFTPMGPSAIIKYVDTDYSSVMIIETQKKQHTIIWFNET